MSQQGVYVPPGAPVDLQMGAYVPEEWQVTATFPATTSAGSLVAATVVRGAGIASLSSVQAPFPEIWHVESIYTITPVPSPDIQLVISVNSNSQPFTVLYSSVTLTNFRAPGLPYSWRLLQGSTIAFSMSNIAVVGGAPISVTFRLKIGRFKVGTS